MISNNLNSFKVIPELKKLVYFLGELSKVITCFKKINEEDSNINQYFLLIIDICKYY